MMTDLSLGEGWRKKGGKKPEKRAKDLRESIMRVRDVDTICSGLRREAGQMTMIQAKLRTPPSDAWPMRGDQSIDS